MYSKEEVNQILNVVELNNWKEVTIVEQGDLQISSEYVENGSECRRRKAEYLKTCKYTVERITGDKRIIFLMRKI